MYRDAALLAALSFVVVGGIFTIHSHNPSNNNSKSFLYRFFQALRLISLLEPFIIIIIIIIMKFAAATTTTFLLAAAVVLTVSAEEYASFSWGELAVRLPKALSDHSATLDPATNLIYIAGGCGTCSSVKRICFLELQECISLISPCILLFFGPWFRLPQGQ